MANGRNVRIIKQVRSEALVALKMVYPSALQAEHLMRTLLVLFPALEFDHLRRDLHYLCDKGYVERIVADGEGNDNLTPWRKRWFRLRPLGVEVADQCILDPALQD